MAAVKLNMFKGIAPRVSPRLLGAENGQVAANCSLTSGELRPIAKPALEYAPAITNTIESIFYADGDWFAWTGDVDATRSPLPGEKRYIFTGDGEPRITNETLATSSTPYPYAARPLGLVAPQTAPTVTLAGNAGLTGETVTRYYVYTFYDDWNQESAPSPVSTAATGQTDDDWEITGMDTAPANSGTVTGVHSSGVTTFTMAAAAKHWLRVGDAIILATSGDTVVVASVPTATTFTVSGNYAAETSWTRKAQWGTTTKRIYRTAGTAANFQLVVDNIASATTSYTDSLSGAQILGDDLLSTSWALPPYDLKGVITLPSGALAGFSGNEICFSEPFQPHAWPTEYRMRSDFEIVSLQFYSSGLVAGTTGNPFQIIGLDPGQMAAQPVNGVYPCVAKRSTVSLVDSVGFATKEGFVTVGDSGVNIISKDWFSRNDWDAYAPTSMEAAYVRGKLYIISRSGVNQLLIFDFLDGTGLTVSYVDATSVHANPITGVLYFVNTVDNAIYEFDPIDGAPMQQDWRSRETVLPKAMNFGAGKVDFEYRQSPEELAILQAEYDAIVVANEAIITAGATKGAVNSRVVNFSAVNGSAISKAVDPAEATAGVNFMLYTDDPRVPLFTKHVTSTAAFRLPAGYKSDRFSIRVMGRILVKSVELAETAVGMSAQ
jgi:hypothetical protein